MAEHYECPGCGRKDNLWEGVDVPGWRSIDDQLKPNYPSGLDREADWSSAREDGTAGCGECGWEGMRRDLRYVVLGIDGKPLPEIHPAQMEIAA